MLHFLFPHANDLIPFQFYWYQMNMVSLKLIFLEKKSSFLVLFEKKKSVIQWNPVLQSISFLSSPCWPACWEQTMSCGMHFMEFLLHHVITDNYKYNLYTFLYINPLSPNSDQHLISDYENEWSEFTKDEMSWSLNKFSQSVKWKTYREQWLEYTCWYQGVKV